MDKPDKWTPHLDAWLQWLTAAGRPESTRYLRHYHVRRAAAEIGADPWAVTVNDLAGHLARPEWSPETRRSVRSSLTGFYQWAHSTGRCPTNPAALLPTVKVPAGKPRPAPESALREALIAADERVILMVGLAAFAGLRRGEIAAVHARDLVEELDGWSLRVVGKGRRVRIVPLTDELSRRLRECGPGWVFPGAVGGHLSAPYIGKLISRVLPEHWTAHTLRHRFASAAYRADRDIRAVQELLGHASVATTQRYTAVPDGALRRAVAGAAKHVA